MTAGGLLHEQTEIEQLKKKVDLLEGAVLSTAGALVDVQFVIADIRAAASVPETPELAASIDALTQRMEKLIGNLEAAVHA